MPPTHEINRYLAGIDKIYRAGNATEHSYRPALKTLFEALTSGLAITNEPKHIACGAPDYIITKDNIPLGYIEAKDISVGLYNKAHKEQFDRYKQSLTNLIITDYLSFQLFADGNEIVTVTIAQESGGGITADKKQYAAFLELINQFTGYSGKTIYNAEQLAKMMASKAKLLAGIIEKALDDKDADNDTLSGQLEGFRKILIHDLSILSFADVYAQTLAYGMFAACLNSSGGTRFSRQSAANLIPQSNPFLRKFFQYIAGFDLDSRISWIVDAMADLFNRIAVEEILKEFGRAGQDPYIHFYETFLDKYDPNLKKERGVFYTPLPIVQFIVQAVDDILQKEFYLSKGLADNSKIKRSISQPDGIKKDVEFHKVQILDPAAGTGTFLAEVLDKIHSRFINQKGMWDGYCKEHLIPRVNGFEILMAPYAMAHFKLDMKLKETGFKETAKTRLRVYLTNSLEEPENTISKLPMVEWLTDEANEANTIKRDTPVMVVLGNPPYFGKSSNFTPQEFLQDYKKEPGGIKKLDETNPKWLNDDYVKFIRYGQNFIEKFGDGVLAFINNHSFLDNPTFRGMRWNLLKTFDKIYILDLHGSVKKREIDCNGGNVFNIKIGTSINIFIKTGKKKSDELAKVYHYDKYGKREEKFSFLQENNLSTINWVEFIPENPHYLLVQKDFDYTDVYGEYFSPVDLFLLNVMGFQTHRDLFAIDFNKDEIIRRMEDLKNDKITNEEILKKYSIVEGKDFQLSSVRSVIKKDFDIDRKTVLCAYRPFDNRFCYYSTTIISRPRKEIIQNILNKDNIILGIGRQGSAVGNMEWCLTYISKHPVDANMFRRGGINLFPLYLYPEDDSFDGMENRRPNLNMDIVNEISRKIGLRFRTEKSEDDNTFAPIDIVDYIYAILHSNNYRRKYKEFLKIDFPRVPYPENRETFQKLSKYGASLRGLHLFENVEPLMDIAAYPVEGSSRIEKTEYKNGKVSINKTQYFENVPLETWEYYIGGYQPAQRWLKDRKDRVLHYDDIAHYQKIITVLKLTIEIKHHIDELIQ